MAVNILIKPDNKQSGKFGLKSIFGKNTNKTLTFAGLQKIVGAGFVYGHRNRIGYVFDEFKGDDIINADIVLYNPKRIGRGIIVCVLENGNIEVILNVPCTAQDAKEYFYIVKKICTHYKLNEFVMDDERLVTLDELDELTDSIILWNNNILRQYLEQMKDQIFMIFGGNNPIAIEEDVRDLLLTLGNVELEKAFADYINDKQQMDVYHMNPRFYQDNEGIFGVYTITETVDSVIPMKPYMPFNSGLGDDAKMDDIKKWIVSFVIIDGEKYDVAGYIKYDDLIDNLPQSKLTKYDASNYIMQGLNRNEINNLLKNQITL